VGGEHLLHRAESLAAELAGYGVRPVHVGIDDSQKVNGFALLFQLFVDAGVIASENAHADDGDVDCILTWQKRFSPASCRKEIVNGNGAKGIWISAGVIYRKRWGD
jgi:hypothetical protein